MGFWDSLGGSGGSGNGGGGGSTPQGAVSAEAMRAQMTSYMDSVGFNYFVFSESDNIVGMIFGGPKYDTYILADLDEGTDCDTVHFTSTAFATCSPQNMPALIIKLNDINRKFRWLKLWVDDDGDLTADCDSYVYYNTVGETCVNVAKRMSSILDDIFDDLDGIIEFNEKTMQSIKIAAMAYKMSRDR